MTGADRAAGRELEAALRAATDVLIAIASRRFDARAPRQNDGSAADALAFLVNATAEEVERLVDELEREQRSRERAQEQLLESAKLAALGRLAGGIAHELNQPLTVIRMVTDLLHEKPDATLAACRADLELMRTAANDMSAIIGKVRAFARPGKIARSPLPALAPLEAALAELGPVLDRLGIAVERDIAPAPPRVLADAETLRQVFVHLLANARDALSQTTPGRHRCITIEVQALEGRVEYAISDNGAGIADVHVARIFDPFFTTKPLGEHKGLGLSAALGIVGDHGGDLHYEPLREGGTRFVVRIPTAGSEPPP
jgi:two-component system C4-dicarboxylate transport sensor histidine kinase DctB